MTRAATPVRPEPTEAQFQAAIVELAHLCGWQTNHTYRSASRRDGGWRTATTLPGWPDLTLFRPGQFLIREIKTTRGRLTVAQRGVLAGLRAAGVDAGTWYPADWPEIERTLRTVPARESITRHKDWAEA